MTEYGLGRRPSPPDSRDYCLGDFLEPTRATASMWQIGPVLDQDNTSHCVGFGWADWGNCLPVDDDYADSDGDAIYYEAKVIDGEPGQEDGSDVRSGAKAMKKRGRLSSYAFGTLSEAKAFLLSKGPVTLGIDWLSGFDKPDSDGTIHASGTIRGGHCILCYGGDANYAWLQNSWGPGWGPAGGTCRISWADLASVFADNGEACAAVELPLTPPAPTPTPTPKPDPTSLLRIVLKVLESLVKEIKGRLK